MPLFPPLVAGIFDQVLIPANKAPQEIRTSRVPHNNNPVGQNDKVLRALRRGDPNKAAKEDAILLRPSMTPAKEVNMATSARGNENANIFLMRVCFAEDVGDVWKKVEVRKEVFEEAVVNSLGKENKMAKLS